MQSSHQVPIGKNRDDVLSIFGVRSPLKGEQKKERGALPPLLFSFLPILLKEGYHKRHQASVKEVEKDIKKTSTASIAHHPLCELKSVHENDC